MLLSLSSVLLNVFTCSVTAAEKFLRQVCEELTPEVIASCLGMCLLATVWDGECR